MKVTQVGIVPTELSKNNRPNLTPELLAATGARYSRNDEGLFAILDKIDPNNMDKSVDSIFNMVDYGHQSIADMVPVALFMDDISIYMAYYIWSLCPTAGGQETSTRYVKASKNSLVDAEILGIPEKNKNTWMEVMGKAFEAYEVSLSYWGDLVDKNPDIVRIPKSLLEDKSDKAQKTIARMKRNFVFDRSRYFIPVAAKTNVMMINSARGWVKLCRQLMSTPLNEAKLLGEAIIKELEYAAPRMLKHAIANDSFTQGIRSEYDDLFNIAKSTITPYDQKLYMSLNLVKSPEMPSNAFLNVYVPNNVLCNQYVSDLKYHDNRYNYIGKSLKRTPVSYGWNAISFAEIRDMNRHRPGNKNVIFNPVGFYVAEDQMILLDDEYYHEKARKVCNAAHHSMGVAKSMLFNESPTFIYTTLLGTQYYYEHTTMADNFIYISELRTGIGSHYKYCELLKDVLNLWYDKFPNTKGLILEGSAEPE